MKKLIIFLSFILLSGVSAYAQFAINTDESNPDNSAMLDVKSSNKGVLIPRMTFADRDAIPSPADGLMVYCTNCGLNGSLSIYSNGVWRTFAPCSNMTPTAANHIPDNTSIVWNWNTVPDAIGYKWSVSNEYANATDMGSLTTKTEAGLVCGNLYTRYVWAYNSCGISAPVTLSQTTLGTISTPAPGVNVPDFNAVVWNWSSVIGADGYKWGTTESYANAMDMGLSTTYTETNLNCASQYTRFVWSYNSCGVSNPVVLTSATTPAPVAPTCGTQYATCASIDWHWNPVTNATGYKWNTTNEYSTAIDMQAATTKTETNLAYGTSYTRFVWAYNPCGNSAPVVLTFATLPAPNSPAEATPIPTLTSITWTWHFATGQGDIDYKWNTTNQFSTAIDLAEDTSYTESGLTCGTQYTRYVWAYNECGPSAPVVMTHSTSACPVCGDPITVNHLASGGVAPVDKSVTYGTVNNIPGETTKCWITKNLGATCQPTVVSDATEAAAGWYWQFNKKQGYKHDGATRTPNTTWINTIAESSDWLAENDPCTLEIGFGYRVPTRTEWTNVDAATGGNWTNWTGPYNSALKMHAAGNLSYTTGGLQYRGSSGYYWSSTYNTSVNTNAYYLTLTSSSCGITAGGKATGQSVRCIK